MPGKVIGLVMNNGFAGSYARQPDMIIQSRPNTGTTKIKFGTALLADGATGGVKSADATLTAALFEGIASFEVTSATDYLDQNGGGEYAPNEAVSVFQRGSINVLNPLLDAVPNGKVYVRITDNTPKKIGDFEATADGANNVLIPNAQWGGKPDANGVAELVLLTRANA
ncbi:MAG: hypothetical protein LBN00_06305 [Oscillospiraceae bacterium]|jgi:hypothetical protein|nr:hypothetical protein [Oscillospiraceae bacterium]